MNDLILYAGLFYLGGGLALYLTWCVVGLTYFQQPASTRARTATRVIRALAYVHPAAALSAQDLTHIEAEADAPRRPSDADDPAPRRVRLDPALGLSSTLLVGSVAALFAAA